MIRRHGSSVLALSVVILALAGTATGSSAQNVDVYRAVTVQAAPGELLDPPRMPHLGVEARRIEVDHRDTATERLHAVDHVAAAVDGERGTVEDQLVVAPHLVDHHDGNAVVLCHPTHHLLAELDLAHVPR